MTTQEILQLCSVEGTLVRLPGTNLERKQYLEVKKALELIGGKWKGGKTQGFIFDQDPTELLQAQANGEQRNLKKEFQFFATPGDLADEMVSRLPATKGIVNVLEPSAGDGALIKAFTKSYSHPEQMVDCYEIMDLNRIKLSKIDRARIRGNDFLECVNKQNHYDIIIANPPFSNNQDIIHIAKMYQCLKPGGTIVTLASPSWTFGSQKLQQDFKSWLIDLSAETCEIDAGRFKDSGTMVKSVMVIIKKPSEENIQIPDSIENKLNALKNLAANKKSYSKELDESNRMIIEKGITAGEELVKMLEEDNEIEQPKVRACRVCGCTDNDCRQCIKKTGHPCHWVEEDLCSACVTREPEEILKDIKKSMKEADKTFSDLEQMLSPKNNDMNFFEQLASAGNVDITMRIMQKNEKLTMHVMPGSGQSTTKPLVMTATPRELDAEFFSRLYPQVQEVTGIIHNIEEVKKEALEKKEAAQKKPAAEKKEVKSKPQKKAAKKVEGKKVEPVRVSLFAAESVTQTEGNDAGSEKK